MAVTFTATITETERVGRQTVVRGTLALSGTYATSGFSVTPSSIGLGRLDGLSVGTAYNGTAAVQAKAVVASNAGTVMLYETGGSTGDPFAEVTNAQSVASYTLPFEGRGA